MEEFRLWWGRAASTGGRAVRVSNVNLQITVWPRDRYIASRSSHAQGPASTVVPARIPEYDQEKCGELTVPRLLAATSIYPALGLWIRSIDASVIREHGDANRCLANVTARRDSMGLARIRISCVAGNLNSWENMTASGLPRSPVAVQSLPGALGDAVVLGVHSVRGFVLTRSGPEENVGPRLVLVTQ